MQCGACHLKSTKINDEHIHFSKADSRQLDLFLQDPNLSSKQMLRAHCFALLREGFSCNHVMRTMSVSNSFVRHLVSLQRDFGLKEAISYSNEKRPQTPKKTLRTIVQIALANPPPPWTRWNLLRLGQAVALKLRLSSPPDRRVVSKALRKGGLQKVRGKFTQVTDSTR
jgi:hypothetical protein